MPTLNVLIEIRSAMPAFKTEIRVTFKLHSKTVAMISAKTDWNIPAETFLEYPGGKTRSNISRKCFVLKVFFAGLFCRSLFVAQISTACFRKMQSRVLKAQLGVVKPQKRSNFGILYFGLNSHRTYQALVRFGLVGFSTLFGVSGKANMS
jgi:hypothetical protein